MIPWECTATSFFSLREEACLKNNAKGVKPGRLALKTLVPLADVDPREHNTCLKPEKIIMIPFAFQFKKHFSSSITLYLFSTKI